MTRIQLSTGFLDLPEGIDFPISISVSDFQGGRSSGFSKAIEIDGTDNNTTLIGAYFDIDLSNDVFDRNSKTECTVIQNGTEVFTGFIQLMEVVRVNRVRSTNHKQVKYKIIVFDEVANFFNEMGDKELTLLSFPELSHTFNRSNIVSSWSNTGGYVYPQFAKEDNVYTLRDFKPAIYEWEYFKKIFAFNGYTFTFDQFDEDSIRMDKRIIPYNGKNGDDSVSTFLKETYTVRGTLASENYLLDPPTTPSNYPYSAIPSIDFTPSATINTYLATAGSAVILDTILEDAQTQYNTLNGELTNEAGQGRNFQILTSYDYEVRARARLSGGSIVAWETLDPIGTPLKSVELKLTLIAQSTTNVNKIAYIDAGQSFETFFQGTPYTFASGYQTLGTGTNASAVNLGVFDANEKFDIHVFVVARYKNQNIAINPLNSNGTANEVIKFVDQTTGDEVRLEFDIDVTNLEFKAVPDITELTKGSNVDISRFIPKGIKQRDLISSISKSYNLYFVPNPDNENNLIIKTRDKYYDDGIEWDWTTKLQEAQDSTITFLNNELSQEQRYRYKEDKDTLNAAYQNEFANTYGESTLVLDNEYSVGTQSRVLLYSPTPSVQAGIGVPLPSINGVSPETNVRVLLHNGVGSIYQYPFYDDTLPNVNELAFIDSFCKTSMFDSDFNPNFSLCFDAPEILFHSFQAGQTSNYLYNLHHQRELTTMNQGERLTAWFNISESDFQKLSKRLDWKIFIKDNGWFYISKVHNYNSTKKTLTKIDLITADEKTRLKFKKPIKPIKPNGITLTPIINSHFANVSQSTNIVLNEGQVHINGSYNFVKGGKVFIQGNNNTVLADGAKIMGDNCTVEGGATNSILIGDDLVANQSGVKITGITNDNFILVNSLFDLPEPVGTVITLADNVTYYLATFIDLMGLRLVSGSNTVILGASSENCGLTSTGLGVGVPLMTSEYTMPIRHITIKDVDTAIFLDGTVNLVAIDWTGVNFLNVTNVGLVDSISNFIFTKGAFLGSQNLEFTGSMGTISFSESIFNGTTDGVAIFVLNADLILARRFRVVYSSFICVSDEIGVDLIAGAAIPSQGLILDTCNFSGGSGIYLQGVDSMSTKALFVNNVGITNTQEQAQYYMINNATVTTVAASGVNYKALGATTSGSLTALFTITDNRATYNGAITKEFMVLAMLSMSSGNNQQLDAYVAKNGAVINESEMNVTTSGSGKIDNVKIQALVVLQSGDYIETFVGNDTSASNITVRDLNVIIR